MYPIAIIHVQNHPIVWQAVHDSLSPLFPVAAIVEMTFFQGFVGVPIQGTLSVKY